MNSSRVIVHVFPSSSWGGAEIYSVQLAAEQRRRGEKIYLWALAESPMEVEARRQGLSVLSTKLNYRLDLSPLKIAKVLKSVGATHVHIHWSGGVWSFGLVKYFYQFKLIYHVHLWMKHSKKDPLHWFLYRQIDKIIVAGKEAEKAVLSCLPVSKKKISQCFYALTGGDVTPHSRLQLNLDAKHFVIGIFSRIDRQKGVFEFLSALKKIFSDFSNVRVLIIGEPTRDESDSILYFMEIKTFVADNFPEGVIQFHGFKKDFRNWLSVCDLLCVPSYHESYSLMILEAFACGIPVLSTQAGGTPDLVNSDRGWLVKPRDVESLKEGLLEILRDPTTAKNKGEASKSYAAKYHRFPQILQCIDEVYR